MASTAGRFSRPNAPQAEMAAWRSTAPQAGWKQLRMLAREADGRVEGDQAARRGHPCAGAPHDVNAQRFAILAVTGTLQRGARDEGSTRREGCGVKAVGIRAEAGRIPPVWRRRGMAGEVLCSGEGIMSL